MSPFYNPATAESEEQHYLKVASDLIRRWAAPPDYSPLGEDITATSTTIPVLDLAEFPDSGSVQLEDERITYTARSATEGAGNLTGAARGQSGTTAATHSAGAIVYSLPSGYAAKAARAERLVMNYLTQTSGAVVSGKALSGVGSKSFSSTAMKDMRRIVAEAMGDYYTAGNSYTLTVASTFPQTEEVV